VHVELGRLNVNLTNLQFLTPELQKHLQALLHATTVNVTKHRTQVCCTYPMLSSKNMFAGTLMLGINLRDETHNAPADVRLLTLTSWPVRMNCLLTRINCLSARIKCLPVCLPAGIR
jgi:hypothetical protein